MSITQYTLDHYVATASNRLDLLAVQKICQSPGAFNPLYLYGPPGVGKTHLLRAIGKEYRKQQKTAVCISAKRFCEEMVQAIISGSIAEFRAKYCQVDVLLVDRLLYVAGKEATQEELLNFLEERCLKGKQTVVVGNVHPSQIPVLASELSAYLTNGLCVEIPMPDFEEKAEIIYQKLSEREIHWPMEVCRYIAFGIPHGTIESEIDKIIAFRELL